MAVAAPQEYQVIARKYRPQAFGQVVGQDHIVRALRNAIEMKRLAHAYLFVGPRGIGKTTTARIFAMALNAPGGPSADFDPNHPVCREIAEGRHVDVREIDGASNNSVDQVRDLRDEVKYPPMSARYKVYIIDEVHMLTQQAFNALLKTLEEPPAHVKFIFATTDVHKVLPTILSRCQRFDLRRIPNELIVKQLGWIAEQEGVDIEPGALEALARFADGGLRDAESSLDQLIAFCGKRITEDDLVEVFGLPPFRAIAEVSDALLRGDAAAAWGVVSAQESQGKDLSRLLSDTLAHLRSLLVMQRAPRVLDRECGPEQRALLERQAAALPPGKVLRMVEQLSVYEARLKHTLAPKAQLEVAFAQVAEIAGEVEIDEILAALKGAGTVPATGPGAAAPSVRPAPAAAVPATQAPAAAVLPMDEAAARAFGQLSPLQRGDLTVSVQDGRVRLAGSKPALAMFRGAAEALFLRNVEALTGRICALEYVETAARAETAAAPAAPAVARPEPLAMTEEELKDDPFIRGAMERFAARVRVLPKSNKETK
jgi:DNA polymerase-3 subunit gamma/tau